MHKDSISKLVYQYLYPQPKPTDPTSFQGHVTRYIIPEVRSETLRYYGQVECLEAQYPGLDYARSAHRMRLGLFQQHRNLFRIFDSLRLVDDEIQVLCRWEGTRWAREQYEKETGAKVVDTTMDGISVLIPRAAVAILPGDETKHTQFVQRAGVSARGGHAAADEDEEMRDQIDEEDDEEEEENESEDEDEIEEEEEDEEESEDELQQSVGLELNQRLLVAAAARARGEPAVIDPDWEQWMKEVAERGGMPIPPQSHAALSGIPLGIPGQTPRAASNQTSWGQNIPRLFQSEPGNDHPNLAAMRAHAAAPPPLASSTVRAVTAMLRPASQQPPTQSPAGTAT